MKLNPDCIRDILFVIEELSTPSHYIDSKDIEKKLPAYTVDEVRYHIRQLQLSKLILLPPNPYTLKGRCSIKDLTPEGHKFIANIRQDTNWNKVKQISEKVGSNSIHVISTIASNVISDIVMKQMGLK